MSLYGLFISSTIAVVVVFYLAATALGLRAIRAHQDRFDFTAKEYIDSLLGVLDSCARVLTMRTVTTTHTLDKVVLFIGVWWSTASCILFAFLNVVRLLRAEWNMIGQDEVAGWTFAHLASASGAAAYHLIANQLTVRGNGDVQVDT